MVNKEIRLVEFLKEHADQITVQENGEIYCWLPFYQLETFTELAGYSSFDEGGIDSKIQRDCIWFTLNDLLDHHGIDHEVFSEYKED